LNRLDAGLQSRKIGPTATVEGEFSNGRCVHGCTDF
jgi:hypothetical protein